MWKKFNFGLVVLCCALAVSACSLFGTAKPESASQGLAYAYGTVATVRQSAATALQSGTISVSIAQEVLKDTDEARAVLDTAETLLINTPASGTQPDVTTYLSQATALLTAAQKLLPQQSSGTTAAASAASGG